MDSEETKEAKKQRDKELIDLKTVLASPPGRRFMWRLLSKCGLFESTFNTETAIASYLSGQQDFGHFLMSEIVEADPNLWLKLQREHLKQGEDQ